MKKRTIFLLSFLGLLLLALLTFSGCKHRPCPSCHTPVPVISHTSTGIRIKTDPVGPNLKVRIRVTSYPGNTILGLDTIPSGETIDVPVPDSIQQVRVQMDYMPINPNLPTPIDCVCPVDIITDGHCESIIVMDVIIQEGVGVCESCSNPRTSTNQDSLYNSTLKSTPGNTQMLYHFEFQNDKFDVGLDASNKLVVATCRENSGITAEPSSNFKDVEVKNMNGTLLFTIHSIYDTGNSYVTDFEIIRANGISGILKSCTLPVH